MDWWRRLVALQCHDPSLTGAVVWGTLGASACQTVLRCLSAAVGATSALVDMTHLVAIDGPGVAFLLDWHAYAMRWRESSHPFCYPNARFTSAPDPADPKSEVQRMNHVEVDTYLSDLTDRWTGGDGWLHFNAVDPSLTGAVVWGTLGASACQTVLRCLSAAVGATSALVDMTHLVAIDGPGVAILLDWLFRRRDDGYRKVRLAGVRPVELATREAFESVTSRSMTLFSDRGEALRWLECNEHASAIAQIERRAHGVTPEPTVRERLKQHITRESGSVSRVSAAKALGMSLRTLQRRLVEEGSTFQHELSSARIQLAQRQMLESEDTLARIAIDVGFNSPAVLSIVFRKLVGESPSEWRDRHSRAPRAAAGPES